MVEEAYAKEYKIKEILEDTTKCIAIIEIKEVPNEQSPAEYMAKLYQKLIDDKIKADTFVIQRKELEEKRKAEDEVIKTAVKEQIGETNVIIE